MPVVERYGGGQKDRRGGYEKQDITPGSQLWRTQVRILPPETHEVALLIDIQTVVLVTVLFAVLGSSWKLHSEIVALHDRVASLQERMAHLEGLFEGLAK